MPIAAALRAVDRARFCLDDQGNQIPQTSAPEVMARLLELLDVQPGNRVLEIGTGSGYSSALLAELTGAKGNVFSIDVDPTMTERASRLLRNAGHDNVLRMTSDGRHGWPDHAPFDRIVAWASAPELPAAWLEQAGRLAVLVVPIYADGTFWVSTYIKTERDSVFEVERVPFGFIPLTATPFGPWETASQ
jgi:protein-L-isoaspartate(D-aspartate) O-methyltransferase